MCSQNLTDVLQMDSTKANSWGYKVSLVWRITRHTVQDVERDEATTQCFRHQSQAPTRHSRVNKYLVRK